MTCLLPFRPFQIFREFKLNGLLDTCEFLSLCDRPIHPRGPGPVPVAWDASAPALSAKWRSQITFTMPQLASPAPRWKVAHRNDCRLGVRIFQRVTDVRDFTEEVRSWTEWVSNPCLCWIASFLPIPRSSLCFQDHRFVETHSHPPRLADTTVGLLSPLFVGFANYPRRA